MKLPLLRQEERLGTFTSHSGTHFILCVPDSFYVKFGSSNTSTGTILQRRSSVKVINPTAEQFPDKQTQEGGVAVGGAGQELVSNNHYRSVIIPNQA